MPAVSIAASAARTTTGQSAAVPVPLGRSTGSVQVNVTAVSGTTPNLALTVEWSTDGTTWFKGDPADAFTAITAATNATKAVTAKGDFLRLVWTITGTTPSFTFSADLWFAAAK